jgi:hypothetical protein
VSDRALVAASQCSCCCRGLLASWHPTRYSTNSHPAADCCAAPETYAAPHIVAEQLHTAQVHVHVLLVQCYRPQLPWCAWCCCRFQHRSMLHNPLTLSAAASAAAVIAVAGSGGCGPGVCHGQALPGHRQGHARRSSGSTQVSAQATCCWCSHEGVATPPAADPRG